MIFRLFKILFNREDVCFEGNWLFTGPREITDNNMDPPEIQALIADHNNRRHKTAQQAPAINHMYGATYNEIHNNDYDTVTDMT